MNKWNGIGNLGSAPTLRTTQSGQPVANFSIAVDRVYYTGEGENRTRQQAVDWIPVVAWGRLGETCFEYLSKGSKVAVSGQLRTRKYTDAAGQDHSVFEIVADEVSFLDRRRDSSVAPSEEATVAA